MNSSQGVKLRLTMSVFQAQMTRKGSSSIIVGKRGVILLECIVLLSATNCNSEDCETQLTEENSVENLAYIYIKFRYKL